MPLYAKIKGPVGYETIGSPTMVDGIATGFSSSNYYKLDTPFIPGNNTWEIVIRAKLNNLSERHTIISYALTNTRSVQLTSTVTGTLVTYLSSNGTSGDLANPAESTLTIQANTWYYFKIRFTRTSYEVLVSEDKENWTTYITLNSSTVVWQGTFFSLGYNYSSYPEPMNGYIDFNESYIKIGDTIFWGKDFARVKLRTTPSVQYSVVGAPTIVNGVVSGFSNNPRADIVTTKAFPTSSPFVIQVKFNTGTLVTSRNQWILSTLTQSNRSICWGVAGASQKIRIYLSSNGSTWDIASAKDGTHVLSNNTDYKVRLTFDGSKYIVSLLVDGDWVDDITVNSSTALSEQVLRFGNNESASAFWPGSIDLKETYIKINNLSWFDGRFNNLTWTPRILEGDYGFTNGKLVWANPNLYLQNTTNEWIDTGIVADETTQAIINYKIDSSREISSSTRNWICGGSAVYQQLGNFYGGFWQTSETNIYYWLNTSNKGSGQNAGQAYTDFNSKYKLELNGTVVNTKSSITKDGNDTSWTYQNSDGEIDQTANFLLFNRYANVGNSSTAFLGKIYNCTISQNSQLVRKLVPVPKGLYINNQEMPSNGMFDIVNQQFYANQGTGAFEFGGITDDYLISNGKLICANSNLYLENDASNWIDTGLTGNYTFDITAKGVTKTGSSQIMIGTSSSNSNSWWGTYSNNGYWSQNNDSKSIDWLEKGNFIVYFTATKSYYVYNGTTYDPLSTATPIRNVTYALFRSKSTASYYAKARLYNCKIYDTNNNLIYHLVPVKQGLVIGNYTVPSNGLFDIVSQTFFANRGTGTFIFGKDS